MEEVSSHPTWFSLETNGLDPRTANGAFSMPRGLWVPGPPEASLSPGSSFNEGEEMTPVSCHRQGFLFCFKLQSSWGEASVLLSGEQTQQLGGGGRQMLRTEVLGTASTTSCPKGAPNPLPASFTLPQSPHHPGQWCSQPGGREEVVATANAGCPAFFRLCPAPATPWGKRTV